MSTFLQAANKTLSDIGNQTLDYCIHFARRRPIFATLIALEIGSWTYIGIKKYTKSFIWWNTILELDLKGDYTMKKRDPFAEIFDKELRNRLSFLNLLHTIKGAGKDWRIKGIFLRMDNDFKMGIAQCEELRRTLLEFRHKRGKKIVVYADNLSYWGRNAIRHYYIASAADRIYMSRDGNLFLGPVTINYPFYKNTLNEKLNIEFEVRRRSQYKSACNIFIRSKFDEYHRSQQMKLLRNIELNFIDCIAKARRLRPYSIQRFLKNKKQTHIVQCLQWIVGEILGKEKQLEYRKSTSLLIELLNEEEDDSTVIKGIFEKKSDEEEANDVVGSDIDFNCNLVHCWSYYLGNYKHPKFYCILQFYDKNLHLEVFYEAVVRLPAKSKGMKQNIFLNDPLEIKDENGNVLREKRTLEYYRRLNDFKPGPKCVTICKPGDIQLSKDDEQYDIDYERGEMRASLKDVEIVIGRNVEDIMHYGYYSSQESLRLGLIDGVKHFSAIYTDVWPQLLGMQNEKQLSFLYLHRYFQRIYRARHARRGVICDGDGGGIEPNLFNKYIKRKSADIAYIGCTNGAIIDGKSTKDRIGSYTVCRQLRAVCKKKNIKGVIIHLDTPGGSVTACHNISQEILAVKKLGIPVIAVQSNIAASGGYHLSAPCDYVISSPSTLTGSIGIIAGKFKTRKFWKDKLGVTHDRVTSNPRACHQYSFLDGWGEYERARIELSLTVWYERFKSKISINRNMSMDSVEEIAKGQIWLGSQALEIGLVDELGGMYEACREIKTLCKLPNNCKIKLVNPLGKMSIWDFLMAREPEHENDFSVPRSALSCIRHSNFISLILSNILSSSFVNSMMLNFYCKPQGILEYATNNDILGVTDELMFLKEEIEMFNGNSALMYDTTLAFYHKKPFF